MFKKLGIKTLALAAVLAAAPAVTFARDWDDYRGQGYDQHEMYRGSSGYQNRGWHNQDRDRRNSGFGWYSAPAPVARGYNGQGGYGQSYYGQGYETQYGVRNSYGNYDASGARHPFARTR